MERVPYRPIRMMDCILLLTSLLTLAPPVFALITDRILGFRARIVLLVSLPLLFLLLAIFLHARKRQHGIHRLILAGLIGGLLGTVALDAVRLVGVRFGAFPMDMPHMFGIIAAGKAAQFQTNTMARIVERTADLSEPELRRVIRNRVHFLASLDETSRRAFMGAMLKGLHALPPEKRARIVETQMSYVWELPPEQSQLMSASMSALMGGMPAVPKFPSGIELFQRVPKVPMTEFRNAAKLSYPQTLQETGLSDSRVVLYGYLWHFMIGSTFGITYTLLFGRGRWAWAFAWGIFVWLSMIAAMPVMMPMIEFPWWFPIVPLVAHLAMAAPIGWAAQRFVDDKGELSSFVGLWRRDRALPESVLLGAAEPGSV